MKSVPSAILREQIAVSAKPTVKIEVQEYGHPPVGASGLVYPFTFGKLWAGSHLAGMHGCAVAYDGSLIRILACSTGLYYQRIVNPSTESDFTSWTKIGDGTATNPCAIAAHPTTGQVIVISKANGLLASEDNGQTWGSWDTTLKTTWFNLCEGISVAYKNNGDFCVAYYRNTNPNYLTCKTYLYVRRKTSGSWQSEQERFLVDDEELSLRRGRTSALAVCHTGDWYFVIILHKIYQPKYMASLVLGDGDKLGFGTWSSYEGIKPLNPFTVLDSRRSTFKVITVNSFNFPSFPSSVRKWMQKEGFRPPTTPTVVHGTTIERVALEYLMEVNTLYMKTSPDGNGVIVSVEGTYSTEFLISSPHTTFDVLDPYFVNAASIQKFFTYGRAIDYRGDYAYASSSNDVWRGLTDYNWAPPSSGTGAGEKTTIDASNILSINERMIPHEESSLVVTLDNSQGQYNSLPDEIKRGSRVNLYLGYTIDDTPSYVEYARYFITSIAYPWEGGQSHLTLNCLDAWGLLSRTNINLPIKWNYYQDDYTIYQMIERILQSIGATLTYKTRSNLITSIYPVLDIPAGENCANILRQLIQYVPDVLYFFGLAGYLIYPRSTDAPLYYYQSPS